jgi:hypothetical protein
MKKLYTPDSITRKFGFKLVPSMEGIAHKLSSILLTLNDNRLNRITRAGVGEEKANVLNKTK